MFSDTYKIKLVSEVLYEVTGKLETRKHGDIQIDGANPSAEEADEGTDEAVESGVDIVLNHRLCETGFGDKKQFTVYLKDYMKKWVNQIGRLRSSRHEECSNLLELCSPRNCKIKALDI